jgi:hypothetical protein
MSSPVTRALRRIFSQPAFIVAAGLLLLAAASLNGTARMMSLHFQKQAVPLAKKVIELPPELGPWVQVNTDAVIDPETEETLQTKEYIFRYYVDRRRVTQETIEAFKDKDTNTQRAMAVKLQRDDPLAVVYLGLTYYTGMVDTVSHIPDRCYVADGYVPTSSDALAWSALAGRAGDQHVNFISFEDQTHQRKSEMKNVAYFFHSNGEYVTDPIGVRKKLQNLWESHGYYAKVELLMSTPDRDGAARQMNDFLTYALPEVEKCLPDWKQVKASLVARTK